MKEEIVYKLVTCVYNLLQENAELRKQLLIVKLSKGDKNESQ